MRGYFGIGIESASKEGNIGNLIRTAHAFGASYCFAVKPKRYAHSDEPVTKQFSDTSKSDTQIPFFTYDSVEDMAKPNRCQIVGVELDDNAFDLPEFRHPIQAVYVLGGERSGLSDEMKAQCDHLIKIPTKFSLNVATAGAIVMYDRLRMLGRFAERSLMPGQKGEPVAEHVHGGPVRRRAKKKKV